MINYRFNQWNETGKAAKEISKQGYELLRTGNQTYSGQFIGYILYCHYIKGDSFNIINRNNKGTSHNIIKGILGGTYSPKTFNAFMELAEAESETLEAIYSDVEEGERIG